MLFGLFGRKKKAKSTAAVSPLAAYDQFLEELERQASEVRKSAATLLSLQGELRRDEEKYLRRIDEAKRRMEGAERGGDKKAGIILGRDLVDAEKLVDATREALARAENDTALLQDAARSLAEKIRDLKEERTSARARFAAGLAVSDALREQSARIEQVLALEQARDEVERAQALAEIWREDTAAKGASKPE